MRIAYVVATVATLGLSVATNAHHSDAGYDQERIIAFQGTVTRYLWRNPHITFYVETTGENGEPVEWGVEAGSTPIMTRSGWSRELFAPGDVVSVRGHPDRRHRAHTMMISVEKSDGSVWIQDESDTPATASATSLNGVWKGIGSVLGPFSRALDAVPLTPAGAAAKASYNFQVDSPIRDCIPPPAPGSVVGSTVYLNGIEVLQDRVIIRSEFFDAERIVYMDGRGHPDNGERTTHGHSIGRWDGATLVVDTVQFADHRSANGTGVPSGPRKHLVERFSVSDDGTRLIVDVELEDPDYLAAPFSGRKELLYTPQLQLYRYDCDPALSRQAGFE